MLVSPLNSYYVCIEYWIWTINKYNSNNNICEIKYYHTMPHYTTPHRTPHHSPHTIPYTIPYAIPYAIPYTIPYAIPYAIP